MKRSTDRILTTHVGSLIRPQPLQEFLRAKQARRAFDEEAYEKCLTDAVADVVRAAGRGRRRRRQRRRVRQVDQLVAIRAGAPVRLRAPAGQAPVPIRSSAAPIAERFAEFYAELDAREALATTTESVCVGPITYTGQAELQRDIDNFKAALKGVKVEEAFLPVAAPASVIPDRKNEYYKSDEDCLVAIGEAMRTEYKMIVDAGFVLQLDDARAAVTYDRMVPPGSFADYRKWVAMHMEVLNHAIEGLPPERIRYHVCWGSWPGPHTTDVPLQGHRRPDPEGEGRRLRHRRRQSAPRARVEGVAGREAAGRAGCSSRASSATPPMWSSIRSWSPSALGGYARLVGRENVIAGTDCGFAQGPFHRRVHPSIMWAKLEALAEGARAREQGIVELTRVVGWASRRLT